MLLPHLFTSSHSSPAPPTDALVRLNITQHLTGRGTKADNYVIDTYLPNNFTSTKLHDKYDVISPILHSAYPDQEQTLTTDCLAQYLTELHEA